MANVTEPCPRPYRRIPALFPIRAEAPARRLTPPAAPPRSSWAVARETGESGPARAARRSRASRPERRARARPRGWPCRRRCAARARGPAMTTSFFARAKPLDRALEGHEARRVDDGDRAEREDDDARASSDACRGRPSRAAPRRRRAARRSRRRRRPSAARAPRPRADGRREDARARSARDMRFMKRSAARTTPTPMATTMSKTTVRTKQVRSTATSLRGATRSVWTKWRTSLMFHATRRSSAASAAIGT